MNVGVGAVIINEAGEILLVRRRLPPEQHSWSLPGGKLELDETPQEALARELQEELGVAVDALEYVGTFAYRSPTDKYEGLSIIFQVLTRGIPSNLALSEHTSIQWFHVNAVPSPLAQPARFALTTDLVSRRRPIFAKLPRLPAEIVLVQPFFPLADRESLSLPLGLATLHSALKHRGFVVRTYDCNIARDYTQFCSHLPGSLPIIVGVQFHSAMSFDWALRTCRYLKRTVPLTTIIGGGELATSRAAELLGNDIVDIIVTNEGEDTLVELATRLRDRVSFANVAGIVFRDAVTRRLVSTPPRPSIEPLDRVPMPEIADLSWREYGQWALFTSRGCPYRCMYCSSAAYWKHSIRYHSPGRVVAELERLGREFGAKDVYIADDTFTLDKNRVAEICRLLGEADLGLRWSCLTRPDCLDSNLLEVMQRAGCVLISFGVETGNQKTLDLVQKRLSMDRAAWALTECARLGVRTRVSLILGLPGETEEDLLLTLEFLATHEPNEVQLYGLTPHDGTALFESLDKLGVRVLEKDPALWSRNVLRPVCETRELSSGQIVSMAKRFIERLQSVGYLYLSDELGKRKTGALKTVATSFSPVQAIGPVGDGS